LTTRTGSDTHPRAPSGGRLRFFAAAIVGIHYLTKYRHLRVRIDAGRLRISLDDLDPITDSHQSDHDATEHEAR
jgi:hypothetical protein